MTRKRYSWDIECELNEATSRKSFYDSLHYIRAYFYSIKQIQGYMDTANNHEHSSADTEGKFHDDSHLPEAFHVHVDHYPPELIMSVV